jgi:hypothetical protein
MFFKVTLDQLERKNTSVGGTKEEYVYKELEASQIFSNNSDDRRYSEGEHLHEISMLLAREPFIMIKKRNSGIITLASNKIISISVESD